MKYLLWQIMSQKCYTQEWVESNPSNLATADGHQPQDESEEGVAAQLYSLCQSVLGSLCSRDQGAPSSTKLQSVLLREELAKLYLWGHSFGPGELDSALDYDDDVRHLVLDALTSLARLLRCGKIS